MGKEDERHKLPEHWVPLGARMSMTKPWEWIYFAVCGAALFITFAIAIAKWKDEYTPVWFIGDVVVVLAISSMIYSWAKKRQVRSRAEMVRNKGYLVCPECTHDLAGVPAATPTARCPECGTPFVAEAMPEVWRRIQERWEESQKG